MAELGGIALDVGSIEIVLANEQTETITKQRLAIAREIPIVFRVLLEIRREAVAGVNRSGGTTDFFDRAETNAIGLAECAVDGSGFGDSHLGATHQRGDIRWIGISVTDKSL